MGESQGGFFGNYNSFELTAMGVPSNKKYLKINDDYTVRTSRIANLSYSANYGRVVTNKLQICFNYRYTSGKMVVDEVFFLVLDSIVNPSGYTTYNHQTYNFLESPKFTNHSGGLEFRYYRYGSLAPVGKYISFGLQIGQSTINPGQDYYFGKNIDFTKVSMFRSRAEIGELRAETIVPELKIPTVFFTIGVGRRYPLTDFLSLGFYANLPFIAVVGDSDGGGAWLSDQRKVENFDNNEVKWVRVLRNSTLKYNRVNAGVSLGLHF